ncbi:hypothetical protein [Chamaesiphon sp. OTE_8_metabat_110]|uniref:hypothetical protein n=1 Tax=Chamaesiphon sp. OTE_8_metabat_110 TaxID=2964696 RepID=UPI00286A03BE|nr:hypothetical protein [Chamaesiphon sp. OTE_8_metabat_110]
MEGTSKARVADAHKREGTSRSMRRARIMRDKTAHQAARQDKPPRDLGRSGGESPIEPSGLAITLPELLTCHLTN